MSSTHNREFHQTPDTDPVRIAPVRRRRKSLRHRFCDGIEAAVKAEPDSVAATRPRTMMGQIVCNLVCRASEGRCDAVRLVVFFLDEGERRRLAAIPDDISEGISPPPSPPEPKWDWDEEGGWDCSGREASDEDQRREAEAKEAKTEALRAELKEMFLRATEAERVNAERKARIAAEREGRNAVTEPAPFSGNYPGAPGAARVSGNCPPKAMVAPISGNSAAAPDPNAPIIRIGGKLVSN